MGDFAHYAEQGLQLGRTVAYEVVELRNPDGTHPVLHVEHLGLSNPSLLEETLAKAGEKVDAAGDMLSKVKANQDTIIKHCARRLSGVFFSDGTAATDADLPGFIRALPIAALGRLIDFVVKESNFYTIVTAAAPQVLAEK